MISDAGQRILIGSTGHQSIYKIYFIALYNLNFMCNMNNTSGDVYDMKIKTTNAGVHYNTKMPTLSSESRQRLYAIRANMYNAKGIIQLYIMTSKQDQL